MDNTAESLNKQAIEVLKKYNIVPEHIAIIQSGSIKTVWKVTAAGRALCLKRLKQTLDKALFSVNAQIHIKKSGGNVPDIILAKDQSPLVENNNQLFVLYEWLEGKDLNFDNPKDLSLAMEGLAKFHASSRGYQAPGNARISSKIGKWPEQYNSMKSRLSEWKNICSLNKNLPYSAAYLKHIDSILELCDRALQFLEKSSYRELCSSGKGNMVLCHQDFGRGNALLTVTGVCVLDLDGVTHDFAARDLRKIIGKSCENKGQWDPETIRQVLDWYTKANPLPASEKTLLYIDLLFPHWFFGLVKNAFQNNKIVKAGEIDKIARLEKSKVSVLSNFFKRGEAL